MSTLRNRKASSRTEAASLVDQDLQEQAQDVMKDNLELMRDVVMQIREDPDFAGSIYDKCPRLQHLLDQYPDLRPIFEDPKLVRINFETVYREAGGVLPEDEKKKNKCWQWFVNSPFMKVLKVLLFFKKIITCIAGGGFALMSGAVMTCCFEDSLDNVEGDDGDGDADGDADDMDPSQKALNAAADHMENPEVQEQMQKLLEDPDNLEDAIENDDDLRALRESSPLCEELMSDPETLKILVDPDNLRALGEAPGLIEADFLDPNGFEPDVGEMGNMEGMEEGYDRWDGTGDDFDDYDVDVDEDFDDEFDEEVEVDDEEEEEAGFFDDVEFEEQEAGDSNQQGASKGKGAQNKNQARSKQTNQQAEGQEAEGKSKFGGIMSSIGAAATDLIAAHIVGSVFSEVLPGDDGVANVGGGGGDVANMAMVDDIENAADGAGDMVDEDVQGYMEEIDEKANETKEAQVEENRAKTRGGTAGTAAGGAAGGAVVGRSVTKSRVDANQEEEEGFQDEIEESKPQSMTKILGSSVFSKAKNLASATMSSAKETVAGTLLGDDFGEMLVERFEGDDEDDEDDEETGKGKEETNKKPQTAVPKLKSIGDDDSSDADSDDEESRAMRLSILHGNQ